jgi:hypothetical protein
MSLVHLRVSETIRRLLLEFALAAKAKRQKHRGQIGVLRERDEKTGVRVSVRLPQAAVRYIVPSHERHRILLSRRRSFFQLPSRGRAYRDSPYPTRGWSRASIDMGSRNIVWQHCHHVGRIHCRIGLDKIPAIAVVGIIVAIFLTEALLIKNRKFSTQSNSVAGGSPAQPTLETTNKSAIDASRTTILGDLTKADNGWQKPNLQFPTAPTRFTLMSTPELKRQLQYTAHDLQRIQDQFATEIGKAGPDRTSAVLKKYATMYEEKFSTLAFSLASAALPRIKTLSNVPRRAASGGQLLYYKTSPDPTSAGDISHRRDRVAGQRT